MVSSLNSIRLDDCVSSALFCTIAIGRLYLNYLAPQEPDTADNLLGPRARQTPQTHQLRRRLRYRPVDDRRDAERRRLRLPVSSKHEQRETSFQYIFHSVSQHGGSPEATEPTRAVF